MVSPDLGDVKLLMRTAMVLTAEARDLGLILQPAKSAVVAGSAQVRLVVRRVQRRMSRAVPSARHVRNFGHELHGPRVLRKVEKEAPEGLAGAQAPTPHAASRGRVQGLHPVADWAHAVRRARGWS
eukprot:6953196-Pyramimonas_sp.AAC.1